MKEILINSYVDKLTKDDIIKFTNKNNIIINDEELDIIYHTIKKDWRVLLHNPNQVLSEIRNKVSPNTYNNIIYFYNLYSKKLFQL